MDARRIVTGVNAEGKSVIVSDGPPPRSATLDSVGGMKFVDLWHLAGPAKRPEDGGDLEGYANLVPPPGGIHWRIVETPPESAAPADVDLATVGTELSEKLPDFFAFADPEGRPGMHKTPTIDFGIVLSGEVSLLLDEGEVHLKPGDCIVQRGTMHAWRNRGDEPCVMAFVLIEAGSKSTG